MSTSSVIENFSPLTRRGWSVVGFPYEEVADAGIEECVWKDEFGNDHRAARINRVGEHTIFYAVQSLIEGNSKLRGELHKNTPMPGVLPEFTWHPWVADSIPASIVNFFVEYTDKDTGQKVTRTGAEPDFIKEIEASKAHKKFYMRRRIQELGLVMEGCLTVFHNDPVPVFQYFITWSNRLDLAHSITFDKIGFISGECLSIDFAKRNGFKIEQQDEPKPVWLYYLENVGMNDGSSIPIQGSMLCYRGAGKALVYSDNPEMDPELAIDFQSIQAAAVAPTRGLAKLDCWQGRFLAFGEVSPHTIVSWWDEYGAPLRADEALQYFNTPGHIYDKRPLGLLPNSSSTGSQQDFGAVKGSPAIIGNPAYLWFMEYCAQAECFRGYMHHDADARYWNPSEHPKWKSWNGYTHWNQQASPDRMGKHPEFWGKRIATGWSGNDEQHDSVLNAMAMYALTGSELGWKILFHKMLNDQARYWSTGFAAREVGRKLLSWANMILLAPSAAEKAVLAGLMEKMMQTISQHGKLFVSGPVRILRVQAPSGSLGIWDYNTQTLAESWSPWEHGIGLIGMVAAQKACTRLGINVKHWGQLVETLSKTLVDWGCFKGQDGLWRMCTGVQWQEDGKPLHSLRYVLDGGDYPSVRYSSTTTKPLGRGTGFWAFAGICAAGAVLANDAERAVKIEQIIRQFYPHGLLAETYMAEREWLMLGPDTPVIGRQFNYGH